MKPSLRRMSAVPTLALLATSSLALIAPAAHAATPAQVVVTPTAARDGSVPASPSPDGTDLAHAYPGFHRATATLPGGAVALATGSGIRTVSGLTASDTLGTRSPLIAYALSSDTDGTLYAVTSDAGTTLVQRIAPDGTATAVLGGGSGGATEGATGTAFALRNPVVAVDPGASRLLFADGGTAVWALDLATGVVHQVATAPQEVASVAVAPDHAVFASFGPQGYAGVQQTASGQTTLLDCAAGCPGTELLALPGGVLTGVNALLGRVVRATDGTVATTLAGLGGPVAAFPDGHLVGVPKDLSSTTGLLASTGVVPAPSYPDAPAGAVAAGPARLDVTVTPKAGVTQRVQVLMAELVAGVPSTTWTVDDRTTDGSGTTYAVSPVRLAEGTGLGLVHGKTFRTWLVASEESGSVKVARSQALGDVEPLVDTTAPAAPGLTLQLQGAGVRPVVAPPADADLETVVLRSSTSGPVATPQDGTYAAASFLRGTETSPAVVFVDPLVDTTFTAFALDTSGNASVAGTATRPAAAVVAGAAVTDVGVRSVGGTTSLTWPELTAGYVRWAPGTTAPATPTDGSPLAINSGYEGSLSSLPLAAGAKAAVSLFSWVDGTLTQLRRTSLVVTGGASSDALSITSTPTVNPGVRPAVTVKLVRATTLGSHGLAGKQVSLYRRTVGTTAWTVVSGQTTPSTGSLSFVVPPATAGTEYQARYNAFDGTPVAATARTTVKQLVTETLSAPSVRRGVAVYAKGALNPKRAAKVQLQKLVSGRWVTVASATSTSTGVISVKWVPTVPGSYTLRLWSPATPSLLAGASPSRVLKVT